MSCCKQKGQNKMYGKCCRSTSKQLESLAPCPSKDWPTPLEIWLLLGDHPTALCLLSPGLQNACSVFGVLSILCSLESKSPLDYILYRSYPVIPYSNLEFWYGGLLELVNLCSGDVHIEEYRNNHPGLKEDERRWKADGAIWLTVSSRLDYLNCFGRALPRPLWYLFWGWEESMATPCLSALACLQPCELFLYGC